jgi:phage shock protein PspC (stress-responsive transcriptional regulator)
MNEPILFGVCANLARKTGWDLTLIRIGFIVGSLCCFGTAAIIYIILALLD